MPFYVWATCSTERRVCWGPIHLIFAIYCLVKSFQKVIMWWPCNTESFYKSLKFWFFPVIKEEAADSRAEVKSFDHTRLKHVETQEKNPLPTPQTLKEEMRPESLPDVSAVGSFDATKLKHVDTQEKNVLPTSDGKKMYFCDWDLTRTSLRKMKRDSKKGSPYLCFPYVSTLQCLQDEIPIAMCHFSGRLFAN